MSLESTRLNLSKYNYYTEGYLKQGIREAIKKDADIYTPLGTLQYHKLITPETVKEIQTQYYESFILTVTKVLRIKDYK